jgi:hypothetical protein
LFCEEETRIQSQCPNQEVGLCRHHGDEAAADLKQTERDSKGRMKSAFASSKSSMPGSNGPKRTKRSGGSAWKIVEKVAELEVIAAAFREKQEHHLAPFQQDLSYPVGDNHAIGHS